MDFKQLEYFKTIKEEGSISRAAEKLYISQQGLSKAVHALEKELDCSLFERSSRGVMLTEAGTVLMKHVEQVLMERDAIVREMSKFREHSRLAIHMAIGSRFSLPKGLFKDYADVYPDVELDVHELKSETCLYNLEHGKADVAVVISPQRKPGYCYEPIKKEKIALVMVKECELAERKKITLTDLEGKRIVYVAGDISKIVLDRCQERGISLEKLIEVPGMVALYQTCAGMGHPGISLASLEGKMSFDNLVSVPIEDGEVVWDIILVYHESMKKVKLVQNFIDYLNMRMDRNENG